MIDKDAAPTLVREDDLTVLTVFVFQIVISIVLG